jgi:DNA-directed RNA polymerase subunit RPC12/RpoP
MTNDDPVKREAEKLPGTQFPRPCEYDGTMMTVTDRGIRCPTCGHEHFDKPRESERSRAHNTEMCFCSNCSQKRKT